MDSNYLSTEQACNLIGISRPTLNKYCNNYSLTKIKIGRRIYYSKLELIEKLLYRQNLTVSSKKVEIIAPIGNKQETVEALFIGQGIIDLRKEIYLDAFGALSLLCHLKHIIQNRNDAIYILVDDNSTCRQLMALGFFRELERNHSEMVHYHKDVIKAVETENVHSILPLHVIGYRGAEKKILNRLHTGLKSQGFSSDLVSYLGWILGELADNCHTHSRGEVCYLMLESRGHESDGAKFLSLNIGDIGQGIPTTLKDNPKYSSLTDSKALSHAFLSDVSCWPDEHKRGKGLNDIIGIAIGNNAWLRIESNGCSLFANFQNGHRQFKWVTAASSIQGTRISLILIDSDFNDISREESNKVILQFIEGK